MKVDYNWKLVSVYDVFAGVSWIGWQMRVFCQCHR